MESSRNISIHAAQEGRDDSDSDGVPDVLISIHAAQEGCDRYRQNYRRPILHFNPRSPSGLRHDYLVTKKGFKIFQSTQPKRAATVDYIVSATGLKISIHAAQEGCDSKV